MRLILKLHPGSACEAVTSLEVEVTPTGPNLLALHYSATGEIADLLVPPITARARADELWQHTCFEAFVRPVRDEAYREYNFAPSGEWAAYGFESYRRGMRSLEVGAPRIEVASTKQSLELRVELELQAEPPWQLALSAVIEEKNGRKSYWALAHPAGKADFHHPDSFACELP